MMTAVARLIVILRAVTSPEAVLVLDSRAVKTFRPLSPDASAAPSAIEYRDTGLKRSIRNADSIDGRNVCAMIHITIARPERPVQMPIVNCKTVKKPRNPAVQTADIVTIPQSRLPPKIGSDTRAPRYTDTIETTMIDRG